jgi:pyruvate dehydrogenase E2 component (dihydrolipoamide acetyltransferase)
MATDIKMPQLSDTMHSGKILVWHKKEGEHVNRGDILAEVETDKANLQIECFQQGTLLKIVIPAGSVATVGEAIAVIGQAGEAVGAKKEAPPAAAPQLAPKPQGQVVPITAAPSAKTAAIPASAPAPTPTPTLSAIGSSDRIKASPLARKIAQQRNIDLGSVQGSGPNGRITRRDLEGAPAISQAAPAIAAQAYTTEQVARDQVARIPQQPISRPTPVTPLPAQARMTPFTKMRETIARRMQESVAQSPHFYVTATIAMDEAVKLREVLKEKAEYKGISLNHLVIKAAAYALQNVPSVNSAVRENQVYEPGQVNIGIITALDDGLLIPVIKDANLLPLKDIVFEARAAVERARAGRPSGTDLSGGTFSISNMGMYDIDNFTAIINPGQGGILAVSSVREEAVVFKGALTVGKRMRATISVDHRIIDGKMASDFFKYFKEALETPALLML